MVKIQRSTDRQSLIMKKGSRLILIASIFFLAACQAKPSDTSGQVVHHVLFWLKNPSSDSDKALLIEGLNTLRQIEEVEKLMVGKPASTLEREVVDNSFDVSELMIFANVEAQDAYQIHLLHQDFIKQYSHLWEKVVVYDVIIE